MTNTFENYIGIIKNECLDNEARQEYISLCELAESRVKDIPVKSRRKFAKEKLGYIEGHHIWPRCVCTEDQDKDKNNLVYLTASEHFTAHILLAEMFEDSRRKYQMTNAICIFMQPGSKHHERIFDEESYELARKQLSEKLSEYWDDGRRHERSESMKRIWSNPVHKSKMMGIFDSLWGQEEFRREQSQRQSAIMQKRLEDADYRKFLADCAEKGRSSPLQSVNFQKWCSQYWNDEKRKEKSEVFKEMWKDPDRNRRRSEALKITQSSPEYRKKRREDSLGSSNANCKTSEDDVKSILSLANQGWLFCHIKEIYPHIPNPRYSDIINNRSWKHIDRSEYPNIELIVEQRFSSPKFSPTEIREILADTTNNSKQHQKQVSQIKKSRYYQFLCKLGVIN
jgi:hypothetical protein